MISAWWTVKERSNPATKGHFGSGHSGGLGSPPVCPQAAPGWLGEGRLQGTAGWGESRLDVVHSKAPRSGRIESDP